LSSRRRASIKPNELHIIARIKSGILLTECEEAAEDQEMIMRIWFIVLCQLFALLWTRAAQAQEVVDVAKITCDQFLAGRVGDFTSMSFWLSGYYHGKRSSTVVDVSTMQKQIHSVLDYCLSHSDVLVMDAVQKVLDAAK
jgi:hypothetical protein